jgi:hypothetical protein
MQLYAILLYELVYESNQIIKIEWNSRLDNINVVI